MAAWVDSLTQAPESQYALVKLLPERNPVYSGRSTNETIRIKGYILAAFERVGLPEPAIPYVLEELESGHHAYLVAGAAKALRGLPTPDSTVLPYLFKAARNIRYKDDAPTFETYKPRWPVANYTTALKEIFATFGWLRAEAKESLPNLQELYEEQEGFSADSRADILQAIETIRTSDAETPLSCCAIPTTPVLTLGNFQINRSAPAVADIEFEDQDSNSITFGQLFSGAPSIVTFFYTRCDNPNKCSLTITKIGQLQAAIKESGLDGQLKTAAVTYDPGYDLPPRLRP